MRFSDAALKSLIQQGEGVALEFKRKINHPKKIAKSLVAFANSLGGFLVIGVDDNGFIYGIEDEKYPAELLHLISETDCTPPVNYSLFSIKIDNKYVLVIEIPESLTKPHFIKTENQPYIRVGDKSIVAGPVQIALMKEKSSKSGKINFGEAERLLFDYLTAYGTITLEKFKVLSGLNVNESSERLTRLIQIGMVKSVFIETTEYFTLA
ncbi:MAG: ATP-binding protein [Bacteroidetes bacterium]|nr:ATP-binding protein [Bacteroidota bacterium]